MDKTHVHYEIAKQWLEGVTVETRQYTGEWVEALYPPFLASEEYRVKSPVHVHADLIIKWAKGASIAFFVEGEGWHPVDSPSWLPDVPYREV